MLTYCRIKEHMFLEPAIYGHFPRYGMCFKKGWRSLANEAEVDDESFKEIIR